MPCCSDQYIVLFNDQLFTGHISEYVADSKTGKCISFRILNKKKNIKSAACIMVFYINIF